MIRAALLTLSLFTAPLFATSVVSVPHDASSWPAVSSLAAPKVFLAAKTKKKGKSQASVAVMFREGMELYNKGQFGPAMVVYSRILQRYPGHEPSRTQLAKTLYRMERFKDAYSVFKQLNPQFMDPETAYEYGLTYYKQNDYEGALNGFNRVTQDHPLRDLACYYGAIAAYKLKRYQEAQELIEGATVLPSKLVKNRDLYRKNIQELRQKEQEEQLHREKVQEVARLKAETRARVNELEERERLAKAQKAQEAAQTAVATKAQAAPTNEEFEGFQEIVNRAGGGVDSRAQAVSYREKDEDLQFNRVFGMVEATPIKHFGKSNGVGMSAFGQLSDRSYDGREQRLDDSEESEMEAMLFPHNEGNDKWVFADAYGFLDVAAGPTRVGLNLGTRYLSRDFKGESTITAPYGKAYIGDKSKAYMWRLSATYSQWNAEKSTLLNASEEEFEASYRLLPELSALFAVAGRQLKYPKEESAEGPDSRIRANVGLEASLYSYFGIGAEYRYWNEKDVRTFNYERNEAVIFDAQHVASKVYLFGHFGTWLILELSATRAERRFDNYASLSDESIVAAQEEEAERITEFHGKAILNLIF